MGIPIVRDSFFVQTWGEPPFGARRGTGAAEITALPGFNAWNTMSADLPIQL